MNISRYNCLHTLTIIINYYDVYGIILHRIIWIFVPWYTLNTCYPYRFGVLPILEYFVRFFCNINLQKKFKEIETKTNSILCHTGNNNDFLINLWNVYIQGFSHVFCDLPRWLQVSRGAPRIWHGPKERATDRIGVTTVVLFLSSFLRWWFIFSLAHALINNLRPRPKTQVWSACTQ